MEAKHNPALNSTGITLAFSPQLSTSKYEMFEVDKDLADSILSNNVPVQIKAYQIGTQRTAALSSNDNTYKLKKLENSNTMVVANLNKGEILKQTTLYIELEKSQTNKYQVALLLSQKYSIKNNEQGISRDHILKQCQISARELDQLLYGEERYKLYIYEITHDHFVYFDPSVLYTLVDQLLIMLNASQNDPEFTLEEVLSRNDNIVSDRFIAKPSMIEYALNYICNYDAASGKYSLDTKKTIKAVAVALLVVKGDYYLKEYIAALGQAMELALPVETTMSSQEAFDPSTNLFEHYSQFDLSFLKGMAIIIPAQELRMVNKTDDVIRLLDIYYSDVFDGCYGSVERRLAQLFEVKDKWTQAELTQYLTPFIDIGISVDSFLLKNTRMLRENNPFDPTKEVNYYLKKF